MVAIRANLQGLEESITRPVLITAVEGIKHLLGLSSDVYTFYNSKDKLYKRKTRDGGIIGDNSDKGATIQIEHEESSEEGNELSLIPARPDFNPIYQDKDIGSSFMPIYHKRRINIHVRYSNKSKSKIFSIVNDLRTYTSSDAMYKLHDFEYYYTIPNFLNKLLLEINNKKNIRIPDGEKLTFEQYLDQTFDDRLDFANTMDADITKSSLVIREKQLDIEGYVEGDLHSIKPEYDDTSSVWYIEFDYTFVYEKPVSLLVKYPILVYNTIIHPFFRTMIYDKPKKDDRSIRTGRAQSMYDVTKSEQDYDDKLAIKDPGYYVPIPEYDTTLLPRPLNCYARLTVVLTVMDDLDKTLLFNINDIPNIKFKETYLNFLMNSERKFIGDEFKSLFHIELWKNEKRDYQNRVVLEEDGTLRSSYELDYRFTYRVSFNVITDLSLLTLDAKKRLRNFVENQWANNGLDSTLDSYKYYWKHINFQKLQRDMKVKMATGNIITDWMSLLKPDPDVLNENLISTNDFFNSALMLTKLNNQLRTVQVDNIKAMFETKK